MSVSLQLVVRPTRKSDNLVERYQQTITKADLIEYYDVSGCYVPLPGSYAFWDSIKTFFDTWIKKLGVENSYFPMFVSHQLLKRKKDHIADFRLGLDKWCASSRWLLSRCCLRRNSDQMTIGITRSTLLELGKWQKYQFWLRWLNVKEEEKLRWFWVVENRSDLVEI